MNLNLFVLKTTILILQSSISRLQTDMMADRSMIFTIQGPSRNWNISPTQDKLGKNENAHDLKQSKKKLFRPKRSSNRLLRPLQQNVNSDPKFTDSLYGILSLLIMTISSFSVTVVPVHNIFVKPEYWYEIIISTSFAPFFMACATTFKIKSVLDEYVIFNRPGDLKSKVELIKWYHFETS